MVGNNLGNGRPPRKVFDGRLAWGKIWFDDFFGMIMGLTDSEAMAVTKLTMLQLRGDPIPGDYRLLGERLGKSTAAMKAITPVIDRHFPVQADGHRLNPRIAKQRKDLIAKVLRAINAANGRWDNQKGDAGTDAME